MTQNVTPFLTGVEAYLKLEPEHPELAVRVGRCLHRMGELPYPEPDKPPTKLLLRRGASEEQKRAVRTALSAPISYITAGPGSGKTSVVLVSAAVSLLRACCSPRSPTAPWTTPSLRSSPLSGRRHSATHP